jgi:hypothetical protein
MNYYVYILIDPQTEIPFYVGKGQKNRANFHIKETKETTINIRKFNKIQSILSLGLSPIIDYYVTNIKDEETAYSIEAELIKKYGRKSYDEDGVLLNICEDNRPPGNDNFLTNNPSRKMKGKTYEELYGQEKAKLLKESRKRTSSVRIVTEETKQRMKHSALKKMENGCSMPSRKGVTDSDETRLKKSLAKKGKKRGPMSEETKLKISKSKRKNANKKVDKPN